MMCWVIHDNLAKMQNLAAQYNTQKNEDYNRSLKWEKDDKIIIMRQKYHNPVYLKVKIENENYMNKILDLKKTIVVRL